MKIDSTAYHSGILTVESSITNKATPTSKVAVENAGVSPVFLMFHQLIVF